MTTYLAITAPTGNEDLGLGDGHWRFAPHLLTDMGVGNFGLQSNVAVELDEVGGVGAELNVSLAYAVRLDHAGEVFIAPLVEANIEAELHSEDESKPTLLPAITPGITLIVGEWHLGAGVQIPIGAHREFDLRTILQVGYHVNWQDLFAGD